jgi:hypothetical protein
MLYTSVNVCPMLACCCPAVRSWESKQPNIGILFVEQPMLLHHQLREKKREKGFYTQMRVSFARNLVDADD